MKAGLAQELDPDLQFYAGPQYLAEGKSNFGIFLDSSPDRWGRVLMDRREAVPARPDDRKAKTLFETDYLLGVHDGHRVGALRFREKAEGQFLKRFCFPIGQAGGKDRNLRSRKARDGQGV